MKNKYFRFKPFTFNEAWLIFRLAAICEAAGWSLLISGILSERYIFKGSKIPVLITGQLHGMAFLAYFAAVLVLSPSLEWRPKKTLAAFLCGIPPFGSLLFEIWAAHNLKQSSLQTLRAIWTYQHILAN